MGHDSSGMQEQRSSCQTLVQGKRNHSRHILPLGTGTSVCFRQCRRRRIYRRICRTACTGTTVSKRFGRFRNASGRRRQHYDSPGINAGAVACHDCRSSVMLSDFTGADKVYIACGYTDLRRGIDGLATIVQEAFDLDPFSNTLFLFCGRCRDRIKTLYVSRHCIGKAMDLSCCTSAWSPKERRSILAQPSTMLMWSLAPNSVFAWALPRTIGLTQG